MLVYDKEEPVTDNLITWVFDENSFVPVAKLVGDKSYSILTDHLGTPYEAYDEEGQKVWSAEYDLYGNIHTLNGEKGFIPFRYQGQYEDIEIGLYYNRFRYYSPDSGTYISQDPIGLAGGLAFYGYVKNSNWWVDVFGLNPLVGLDLNNMDRNEIKAVLEKNPDIQFKGQSPDGTRMHWEWVETGEYAARIDPPDNITTYDHIHLYDKNGNPLDIDGNIVDRKDPEGHIKIKCI